ncbi:MAG: tyrosine-type recombinase/integrase [Deltaproteobacteria bacterium]|nr:tyrosine-type recombinase/integrase [Deltaproteobacteria bacterium]
MRKMREHIIEGKRIFVGLEDSKKTWRLRAVGLSEYLHLHSLKHTFITLAIENGMSIRDIQRHVDHSRIAVTELYSHDRAITRSAPTIGLDDGIKRCDIK